MIWLMRHLTAAVSGWMISFTSNLPEWIYSSDFLFLNLFSFSFYLTTPLSSLGELWTRSKSVSEESFLLGSNDTVGIKASTEERNNAPLVFNKHIIYWGLWNDDSIRRCYMTIGHYKLYDTKYEYQMNFLRISLMKKLENCWVEHKAFLLPPAGLGVFSPQLTIFHSIDWNPPH